MNKARFPLCGSTTFNEGVSSMALTKCRLRNGNQAYLLLMLGVFLVPALLVAPPAILFFAGGLDVPLAIMGLIGIVLTIGITRHALIRMPTYVEIGPSIELRFLARQTSLSWKEIEWLGTRHREVRPGGLLGPLLTTSEQLLEIHPLSGPTVAIGVDERDLRTIIRHANEHDTPFSLNGEKPKVVDLPAGVLEQLCYDIAYIALPGSVFGETGQQFVSQARKSEHFAAMVYYMFCKATGIEPLHSVVEKFRTHQGVIDGTWEYIIIQYPPHAPNRETHVLAPYFSGIVTPRGGGSPQLFVLGQAPLEGTTFRCVDAAGRNRNLGPGDEPTLDSFVGRIREHLEFVKTSGTA